MNIKQAETMSGVSRRNIRYYEQEGLISPVRNSENDYREYAQEDIDALKLIRALRMIDMPLEQIRQIIGGQTTIRDAASLQKEKLVQRVQRLETAIRFCEELGALDNVRDIDIDGLLSRMNTPENQKGLFQQWVSDYKKVAQAEHEKVFSFIPDTPVTDAREFTTALLEYARKNDLELVITKESMYPEFTIDGVEYTAERFYSTVYRIPVATVRCTVKHPEEFETDVPMSRKKYLKALHYGCILILLLLLNIDWILRIGWQDLFTSWEGWLVLIALLTLFGTQICLWYFHHYNENGKKGGDKKA